MPVSVDSKLVDRKVVCPHCWSSFYADQAKYISAHPKLYGDPVLGSQARQRLSPDQVRAVRGGHVYDTEGAKVTERSCPHCHLQIPTDLLERRPFFVSVVGSPYSGKTYFLTSMVHNLRKELATYFGFSFQDSDSHDVRAFLDNEQALFFPADPNDLTLLKKTEQTGELYNEVHINGQDIRLPKPFIFSLRPTESNIDFADPNAKLTRNFVLYDNAGESFALLKEQHENNHVTQHLSRTNAVFFAYDPLQDASLREKLKGHSNDPQLGRAAFNQRQETILSEVANRMRRHGNKSQDERLSPPLCVCVQKFDVWKSLLKTATTETGLFVRERFESGQPMTTAIRYNDEVGVAGLDREEVNIVSVMVGEFIRRINPEFHAMAEANFKVVRYFAVSALGTSPQYDSQRVPVAASDRLLLKVRPADIKPFHVTHPMLWLMQNRGLIHCLPPRSEGRDRYPHATIVGERNGRFRVRSPLSARIIALDREYLGSTIEDPFSGNLIWVPTIDSLGSSPEAKPPAQETVQKNSAQTPPNSSLQLSLDPPPKLPKKGWFHKGK